VKTCLLFLLAALISMNCLSQDMPGIKTIAIEKKLRDFPDRFDLTSPLSAFVSFNYAYVNKRTNLLREACSISRRSELPDSASEELHVSDGIKELHLDAEIIEVIVYHDSLAYVISKYNKPSDSYYSIRKFYLEQGKWENVMEVLRDDLQSGRVFAKTHAEIDFDNLHQVYATFLK